MRQFLGLLAFELRLYAGRVSTHVFFALFLGIAAVFMAIIGGAFEGANAAVAGSGGNVHANSPHVVMALASALSLFGLLVVSAVAGNAASRDFHHGLHALVFTTPVGKARWLASRYVASIAVNAYVLSALPIGLALSTLTPWLDEERLGPFSAATYVHPMVVTILPNVAFAGAIFFTLAALTRRMLPNYVGGVLLFVGYLIAAGSAADVENERMAALLDPFGLVALGVATQYATPAEKNELLVPLQGVLLWNRVIWGGVGLVIVAAGVTLFRFRHPDEGGGRRRRGAPAARAVTVAPSRPLPGARRAFGAPARLAQFLSTARTATVSLIGNVYFLAIAAAGFLFVLYMATQVGKLYGTTTWPVTYQVVELLGGTFGLFLVIVITYLSGELAWHERDLRMAQLHDTLPVPTWIPFLGKLTALVVAILLLLSGLGACCLLTQAFHGWFRFEPLLLAQSIFGLQLVTYVEIAVLAFFVHALVNQKAIGHLVLVLVYAANLFAGTLGIEHHMLSFGSDPGVPYSDMNGFGFFLGPWAAFHAWWGSVALVLAVLAGLLWPRGTEPGWRPRLAVFRRRLAGPARFGFGACVALALASGSFVFWNTNVRNEYRTSIERERLAVRLEREFKQYQGLPQPRVVGVEVEADIFPSEPALDLRGTYRLVNRDDAPVTAVHVRLPERADVRRMELSRKVAKLATDEPLGYHVHELAEPLLPGETMTLAFELRYALLGFTNDPLPTGVVENGTFFNSTLMPSLGYDERDELSDDDLRRKHGLEAKRRMPPLDDPVAKLSNYISNDADWVDFAITVSTDQGQMAIAPGYLEREWNAGGRRYFRYVMDAPILHFYSVLSARYAVKRDAWKDVAIEVWHHPTHDFNVDRMIAAVKDSLDYYTAHFSPYQHRQVRIVEFPRYATFAQSFPNTIPYSESIGFIARIDDPDDIDYVTYVTAHEVAHQWFAHQVIGANVQGATVLSESLSQYAALMVMEREHGAEHVGRFLEYELDRYLQGRSLERKAELPLLLNEDQSYIHYNKASVVLYALRDHVGEEPVNLAIRRLLERTAFKGPPYPTSRDLLDELRAVTPPELQVLLDDTFVRVTLHDNRVEAATATKQADGTWLVALDVEARKLQADETGNEAEVPMDDLVEIGVFAEGDTARTSDDAPLYLEKRRLAAGRTHVEVVVPKEPVRAGIDPRHLLVDRIARDNVRRVEKVAASVP